jgi:peptidoglycan/xylan/chitin deacetylase (PgdA/CDA1 family)
MILKKVLRSFLRLLPIKGWYRGIGHILMFHSILPERSGLRIANHFLEVTPAHLEKVITFFLKKGYTILSLDEMVEHLSAGKSQTRFVVFTFDDGYLDNLTYAYPVFKKYNIPFTIYITTNFPNYKTVIWWYPLEEILRISAKINFIFNGINYRFNSSTIKEKEEAFIKIRSLIQQCNEQDKQTLLDAIFEPFDMDLTELTKRSVLNWEQIKMLSNDPLVTIGAHTINHYRLGALSAADAEREIKGSIAIIQERTGKEVKHLSFPFGTKNDVGEREFAIARSCGLKTATTTRSANIFAGHKNYLHALPRINIDMFCNEKELKNIINGHSHFMTYKGKTIITD